MTETATRGSMVHLPAATLAALHRAVADDRGAPAAAALIRQVGFESGEGFYDAFRAWLEHHDQNAAADPALVPADEFWHRLSGFFFSLGWGRLHFEQVHPGVASLSSEDWAEAEAVGPGSRQPACHFSTGLLADLLGRVSGDDLAVLEVECRSRGDAECRFLLGGGDALSRLFELTRQGLSYRDAVQQIP